MKKICLISFSLLIFLLSFNTSFAKDSSTADSTASDSAQKRDYQLPYPGLLPDSPLYFLRIIRDRTISFLISDPLKKAEFNLLQADKRLNAGVSLVNKNKNDLALSTISKAENYFEEALQKTREAKKQGMETTDLTSKLIDASGKHIEVLKDLLEKAPQNLKSSFAKELQRAEKFIGELYH